MSAIQDTINQILGKADNVISEEGVKADITINLDPSVYVNLAAIIILGFIVGNVLADLFKRFVMGGK